jgi:hypothetical protein
METGATPVLRGRIRPGQNFPFFLFEAFGTHAVGGAHGKLGTEILFHREPLAVVADAAAPAADAEKLLEIVQAFEQPARQQVYPGPNRQDDDGAKRGAMPVGLKGFAKNIMRDVQQLRQPGKHNQQREAQGFGTEDGIALYLTLLH